MNIVPATPDLLRRFYGQPAPFTLHGYVAVDGDDVLGVGGISYVAGRKIAFSDFDPRLSRKDRARCFRFLEKWLVEQKGTLFAMCSGPNSRRLLERLGFTGDIPMMVRTR